MLLELIVKVIDLFLGLKNTFYQLRESRQLNLKYRVHIALNIKHYTFSCEVVDLNLVFKSLSFIERTFTCYLYEWKSK